MMMKRILFVTLLLLSAYTMRAQEAYRGSVAEDHKRWEYQFFPTQTTYNEFYTDGDTVIAGHHAYRLYYHYYGPELTRYEGAIFDEGRKTYIIDAEKTEPRLLLDFDVTTGDTFWQANQELIVKSDTIVSIEGQYYRLLKIYNKTRSEKYDGIDKDYSDGYWIEGIGSTAPYFTSPAGWSSYYHNRLDKCYVSDKLVFHLANFDTPTVIGEFPKQAEIETSPIYDLQGRRVSEKGKVNSEKLPRGVYIQNGRKFVVK